MERQAVTVWPVAESREDDRSSAPLATAIAPPSAPYDRYAAWSTVFFSLESPARSG